MSGTHGSTGLRCATHGPRDATLVCGDCGEPLCEECANGIVDPTLNSFEKSSIIKPAIIVALIAGIPFVFAMLFPDLLGSIRQDVFPGKIIPFRTAIVHSSIILGVALLPSIYYRTGDRRGILTLENVRRELCDDCRADRGFMSYNLLVAGLAVLLVGIGVYQFATSIDQTYVNARALRISALGVGVYMLKDELTRLVGNL